MEGGEFMIKKISLAAGIFGISLFAIATMTFAQTPTTTPTPTQSEPTPTETETTPSPTRSVPGGAPATGRAN